MSLLWVFPINISDAVQDDAFQQLINKLDQIEKENSQMKSYMDHLLAKVAKMEKAMIDTEENKIEIDVQDKVEMLEKLSALRTCSEYTKFGLGKV